jgi:hypothetical protein
MSGHFDPEQRETLDTGDPVKKAHHPQTSGSLYRAISVPEAEQ